MAFDVYPQPQTAPLSVAPGPAGSTVALAQERRSAEAQPKMYLRVAIVGSAVAPTFKLQAGTGDPVVVPSPSGIWDLPGGPGNGNYVADSFLTTEANGVTFITVFLYLGTPSTWKLTLVNNDAAARDFTWVVATSDAESKQPWIETATTLAFDVLTGESGPLNLRLFNKGTGPLGNLGGALSGADAASFAFAPPGASSVLPNGTLDVPVTLSAIASPKTAAATLVVSSDDTTAQAGAGHNKQVALSAKVGQLELAFMLDASGSMAFGPNGEHFVGIDNNSTRWGKLQAGIAAALAMLKNFGAGKGNFAVGMYPDISAYPADPTGAYGGPFPVPSPSAANLAPPSPIGVASVNDALGKVAQHFPRENGGATPMGAGIGQAIGLTSGSPWGYFGTSNLDLNRRWLILMTDGNHNSGPPAPADFFGTPQGFAAKKVRVMALGYGNKTAPFEPVNETLLTQIRDNAYQPDPNAYHLAQADNDPALTTAFIKSLLFAGLTLDTISDPSVVVTSANPTITRQVSVTAYDQKLSFIVAWTTFDQGRLDVSVQTPLGEVIDAAGTGGTIDVNPRFKMLTFDAAYLHNLRNPGKPRHGTWTLTVTLVPPVVINAAGPGKEAAAVDSERFDYQVLIDSRLKLRTRFDRVAYAAGDKVRLSADLTLDGQGLPGAAAAVARDVPGVAHLNWLAASPVTAAEYAAAATQLASNPDVTSIGIKQAALGKKGVTFVPFGRSDVVNMVDADGTGVYAAETADTAVPGDYRFLVTAVGTLPDGSSYRRERHVDLQLGVRADPAATQFTVAYLQLQQGNQTLIQATMTVRPLDAFGNVVMIDPRVDPSIRFNASGGTLQGPIVDNHDGSYTQVITYPPDQVPAVGVTAGGVTVVPPAPLVQVSKLRWVDRVFGFQPGQQAVPGSNQHPAPGDCLGDPTTRPSPKFVSLGGGGSLVVGFSGHYVLGHDDQDLTVFIQPDAPLRPYVVEVSHDDDADHWFEIGRSVGVTQSFGLRHHHHLPTARAIRIRDLSWRLRNPDGTPSATPGVSVAAVGARRVERGDGDLDDLVVRWLRRIGHQVFGS